MLFSKPEKCIYVIEQKYEGDVLLTKGRHLGTCNFIYINLPKTRLERSNLRTAAYFKSVLGSASHKPVG